MPISQSPRLRISDLQQLYAALICRLMVFTPVFHAITWITTHLTTGGMEGWVAVVDWMMADTTHEVVTRSGTDQEKSACQRRTS